MVSIPPAAEPELRLCDVVDLFGETAAEVRANHGNGLSDDYLHDRDDGVDGWRDDLGSADQRRAAQATACWPDGAGAIQPARTA